MKILFVSSGNKKLGISPTVKAQGESLKKTDVVLDYFTVIGKGTNGYVKNIFRLRKFLKNNNFDLIHSHFFLSSIVATLTNPKKLVVSLMGSDVYRSLVWNILIRLLHKRWNATIVKSEKMKEILALKDLYVIPNGVNLEKFYPVDEQIARKKLGWDNKKYILFASSTDRPEKNFKLAQQAVKLLNDEEIEFVALQDIPHDSIVYYLNASDIILMTSKYEGSPNIIKEAMACNCPIVSTDVGDIREVIGDTKGCYITSFEPVDVTEKIKMALEFGSKKGRTNGRERISEFGLDSESVAKKIIEIYSQTLLKSKN